MCVNYRMKRNIHIILSFLCLAFLGTAQVKVSEWKDHLSYNSCNTVAKAGDAVYASNGTGIIKYTISDGSTELISKINGLSDIGITLLRYNPYNGALLIVYNNANIDVLKDGVFTNFPDIKRKTITGKKNINEKSKIICNGSVTYALPISPFLFLNGEEGDPLGVEIEKTSMKIQYVPLHNHLWLTLKVLYFKQGPSNG